MHFVIAIAARDLEEEFLNCMRRTGAHLNFASLGQGTVTPGILELLGLERTEKSVLFSLCTHDLALKVIRALTEQIGLNSPGRGIALALPLTSMDRRLASQLKGEQPLQQPTDRQEEDLMNLPYELIIAIVDKGTSDLVMDAARAAGAPGGTVLHAKGTDAGRTRRFFGISLAEEREMVFIVVPAADKSPIMRSIAQQAGAQSETHALLFSLPVSAASGISLSGEVEDPQEEDVP